ncbi:hypothetical protein [Azospirillum soli]|uniref:hypothetical protein n=1 Tax=Azospirillum soli TaxID=1304799 RepID=UPI001AE8BBDC|nr:hypothetical protein [Azospirillum soli]MBP2316945.1 hypothetical protein [Azospirillum soli]
MSQQLPDIPTALAEQGAQQVAAMLQEAFHAGFRQGWQEALMHINRMAAAAIGGGQRFDETAPPVIAPRINYDAMRFDDDDAADERSKRQRAPRGSVPAAVDEAFARGAPDGLTYTEIIRRIRASGNDEIKESSIRNEMRRRLSREEAVDVDGRWYLLPSKQEAPQDEPDGASADQIQEPTFM